MPTLPRSKPQPIREHSILANAHDEAVMDRYPVLGEGMLRFCEADPLPHQPGDISEIEAQLMRNQSLHPEGLEEARGIFEGRTVLMGRCIATWMEVEDVPNGRGVFALLDGARGRPFLLGTNGAHADSSYLRMTVSHPLRVARFGPEGGAKCQRPLPPQRVVAG